MNSINCTKATQLLKTFQVGDAIPDQENSELVINISFKRGQPGDGRLIEYCFPKSIGVSIEKNDQVYGYISASLNIRS